MKTYRILERIMAEGTEDQTSLFYPQYVDSHTLDQNITATWFTIINSTGGAVTCTTKEEAVKIIQKKKAQDMPPRDVIHEI
jgi:hypothetical protein